MQQNTSYQFYFWMFMELVDMKEKNFWTFFLLKYILRANEND